MATVILESNIYSIYYNSEFRVLLDFNSYSTFETPSQKNKSTNMAPFDVATHTHTHKYRARAAIFKKASVIYL